ncbi:hypothetical protein, partial [Salmonella sp. s51228]|uniref:hypothetical protein n=1 Tax=Salmonella sp. s51228 TaxID=3159652 RepID=UPI0039815A06
LVLVDNQTVAVVQQEDKAMGFVRSLLLEDIGIVGVGHLGDKVAVVVDKLAVVGGKLAVVGDKVAVVEDIDC